MNGLLHGSAGPATGYGGEFSLSEGAVVGLAAGAFEWDAECCFPACRHALAGVAAPGLAIGFVGKNRGLDAAEFALMKPLGANGNNFSTVVETEAVFVRVAEVIKGLHGAAWAVVECADEVGAGVDPDERRIAFGCLQLDHRDVVFSVFATAHFVGGTVNDPYQFGGTAIDFADFIHAHCAAADEIGPPLIMLVVGGAIVLPTIERGATRDDDVISEAEAVHQQEEQDGEESLRHRAASVGEIGLKCERKKSLLIGLVAREWMAVKTVKICYWLVIKSN